MTTEKPGRTFLGWTTNGTDLINPEHSSEIDFERLGNIVHLKAVWDNEPIKPITHNLRLTGLAGIDQSSINTLKAQGFTVKGDTATKTFTSTDSKFYLPALNKPGSSFLGWYETGKSPSTASPYVEFEPVLDPGEISHF